MGYGAAISAGGNILGSQLQGWASLLDKWAMADAYSAELARQNKFRNQAMGVFNAQLPTVGSAGAQQQLSDSYGSRLGQYNVINQVPLALDLPYQRSASGARDAAAATLSGSQRANQMKYGDWQFNTKMGDLETGRKLDQITNFAGGTSRVFPYRMYDAQHAWDVLAEIGASISAASSGAAGAKAAFGGGPPVGGGGSGGYGAGLYAPMGPQYPMYSAMPGYMDAYGNIIPTNYNNLPTGMTPG